MIVRILVMMAVFYLAWRTVAKWLAPRVPSDPKPKTVEAAEKCSTCGAYRVAGAACTTPGCADA